MNLIKSVSARQKSYLTVKAVHSISVKAVHSISQRAQVRIPTCALWDIEFLKLTR